MKNLIVSSGLLAAGLLVALPGAASAAFLSIDMSQPGGVNFNINDFEFGFNINGNLVQIGLSNPANVTMPTNTPIAFDGSWIDLGAAAPANRTVYFVDPSSPTSVVGMLSWNYSTDGVVQGFISGTFNAGGLGSLPGGVNPGDVYLADGSTFDFSNAFIGAQVITPTSGAAAVLGLGGLAGMRRRRR